MDFRVGFRKANAVESICFKACVFRPMSIAAMGSILKQWQELKESYPVLIPSEAQVIPICRPDPESLHMFCLPGRIPEASAKVAEHGDTEELGRAQQGSLLTEVVGGGICTLNSRSAGMSEKMDSICFLGWIRGKVCHYVQTCESDLNKPHS